MSRYEAAKEYNDKLNELLQKAQEELDKLKEGTKKAPK